MEWTDPGQSINFHKFGDTQNFDLYDIWSCDSCQHAHHICSVAGGMGQADCLGDELATCDESNRRWSKIDAFKAAHED